VIFGNRVYVWFVWDIVAVLVWRVCFCFFVLGYSFQGFVFHVSHSPLADKRCLFVTNGIYKICLKTVQRRNGWIDPDLINVSIYLLFLNSGLENIRVSHSARNIWLILLGYSRMRFIIQACVAFFSINMLIMFP